MDELIAFLRARYAERETAHHHAGEGRIAWLTYNRDDGQLSHTTVAADHHDGYWCADGKLLPEPASVLVIYDQAEALADIAGKLAIIDMAEEADEHGYDLPDGVEDGRDQDERECDEAIRVTLAEVLHHLASEFAGHPDYNRNDWGPLGSGNPLP